MRDVDDTQPIWRRFLPQLVVLVVALLALIALRVARSDGDGASPASNTTEERGSDDPAPTDGSTTTSTTAAPPVGDEGGAEAPARRTVERALLTLGDLPSGWSTGGLGEEGSTKLCEGHDPSEEVAAEATARAAFIRGSSGQFLTNIVTAYGSDDRATDFLREVSDAIDGCATYQENGSTFHMQAISVDDIGDEAVALRLTGKTRLGDVAGRVYYVRVDDRVAMVAAQALGEPDIDVALDALRTVVDRL